MGYTYGKGYGHTWRGKRRIIVVGAPAAPVNTVPPAITGTTTVGQTLTAGTGSWTATPSPTFAFQWKRAGVNIGGATVSTYLLQAADATTLITVTVTATNASGSASATSASVGPIAALVSVFREPNTNLLPFPEAFNSWATISNIVVTPDALANPEGVVNADLVTDSNIGSVGAASFQTSPITLSAASLLYRYSVYVKAGTAPWIKLASVNYTGLTVIAYFNASTGASGTSPSSVVATGADAPIDGWIRVWCTFNSVADLVGNWTIAMCSADGVTTINRNGTQTMNLWLAQLAVV